MSLVILEKNASFSILFKTSLSVEEKMCVANVNPHKLVPCFLTFWLMPIAQHILDTNLGKQ
jgi:hypothetical protein